MSKNLDEALKWYGYTALHETKNGWTPLAFAVLSGEKRDVATFLDHGADIEARDNDDRTPLHLAVLFRQREVAELLLQRGADINAVNNVGKTPLDDAREREAVYRGSAPGEHYAELVRLLEAWSKPQQQPQRPRRPKRGSFDL